MFVNILNNLRQMFFSPSTDEGENLTLSDYVDKTAVEVASINRNFIEEAQRKRISVNESFGHVAAIEGVILRDGFSKAKRWKISTEEGIVMACDQMRREYEMDNNKNIIMRPGEADKLADRRMQYI